MAMRESQNQFAKALMDGSCYIERSQDLILDSNNIQFSGRPGLTGKVLEMNQSLQDMSIWENNIGEEILGGKVRRGDLSRLSRKGRTQSSLQESYVFMENKIGEWKMLWRLSTTLEMKPFIRCEKAVSS